MSGLLIELQYRTQCQHAWAIASELISYATGSEPKFERGNPDYRRIMRLASETIARACENMRSSLPRLSDQEVVEQFNELDGVLGLMGMFRALNIPNVMVHGHTNAIFVFSVGDLESLKVHQYDSTRSAWKALLGFEVDEDDKDIVFVCGETPEDIRASFSSYFSDARSFVDLIDQGRESLVA